METEVKQVSIPAGDKRLDFVLITNKIQSGVTLKQWDPAEPMSDSAINKFDSEPFIKLYDNGDAKLYYIDF